MAIRNPAQLAQQPLLEKDLLKNKLANAKMIALWFLHVDV